MPDNGPIYCACCLQPMRVAFQLRYTLVWEQWLPVGGKLICTCDNPRCQMAGRTLNGMNHPDEARRVSA